MFVGFEYNKNTTAFQEYGGKNKPIHKSRKKLVTFSYYIYKGSLWIGFSKHNCIFLH